MDAAGIVGVVAATASVASFAPQALKIIRARDTKGLSLGTYLLTCLAFAGWLTFGILNREWALIVPNSLCLLLSLFIATMIALPTGKTAEIAEKLNPQD